MIGSYPSPQGGEEYALTFDRGRAHRLLVLPALFDEGNKLRHFTVEVMRRLEADGIDTFLPDFPGCNESLSPLEAQALATWREAARLAESHFSATHVLALRGGALVAPDLPGWAFAPVAGQSLLNALMRAQIVARREAGLSETREALLEAGVYEGLELAGQRLGPEMVSDLWEAQPVEALSLIAQAQLGGSALWLRAEPDHSAEQANALAAVIADHFT